MSLPMTPHLSDLSGFLVIISPRAFDVVPARFGTERRMVERMRCDIVVLDPPTCGPRPRHMAIPVGRGEERSERLLPARFDDIFISAVGILAYCRPHAPAETAGRLHRFERMSGGRVWGVRPVTPTDAAILDRYRERLRRERPATH